MAVNLLSSFPRLALKPPLFRVRHFSIMEYYRSVRPAPETPENNLIVRKEKEVSVTHTRDREKKSTRPYVGPQISTRHPVPVNASTVSWVSPQQPDDPRFLKVALLGLPNSGKSSFLNALLNTTISSVSPKVNTTREDIKGILTVDNSQVVLIDAPGIIASHKRRKFCRDLVKTAWRGLEEADLCLFVVDVVRRPTSDLYNILRVLSGRNAVDDRAEPPEYDYNQEEVNESGLVASDPEGEEEYPTESEFSQELEAEDEAEPANRRVPVALVLNKIDLASHKKWVKSRLRELKVHGNFCDVFYTSAKHGIGLLPVINFLKRSSRPGPWVYPPDMVTTLSKVKIVEQLVRTYIFCWFNKDVPYKVDQSVIGWTYAENGTLNIEMELYVRTVKVAKMICGVQGRILKQMQKNVSFKLSRMWNELVFLFIHIKVR